MQKRRKSSPNYPNSPHSNANNKSGERTEGYSKGRFSRDKQNEKTRNERGNRSRSGKKPGQGAFKRGKKTRPVSRQKLPTVESDNQVTDGKFYGRELRVSESPKMAPTGRKIRAVFFRILYRRIRARRFLDLCAGSGTVGIDALSRGALLVTMVERKAKNCSLIRENLETLGINEGHGEVVEAEVIPFLKQMAKRRRFWDVVYFAPPFDFDYDEAFECFKRGFSIKPGGIFVIEHHPDMFFPEKIGVLTRWKVVIEDDAALSFYDRIA